MHYSGIASEVGRAKGKHAQTCAAASPMHKLLCVLCVFVLCILVFCCLCSLSCLLLFVGCCDVVVVCVGSGVCLSVLCLFVLCLLCWLCVVVVCVVLALLCVFIGFVRLVGCVLLCLFLCGVLRSCSCLVPLLTCILTYLGMVPLGTISSGVLPLKRASDLGSGQVWGWHQPRATQPTSSLTPISVQG